MRDSVLPPCSAGAQKPVQTLLLLPHLSAGRLADASRRDQIYKVNAYSKNTNKYLAFCLHDNPVQIIGTY